MGITFIKAFQKSSPPQEKAWRNQDLADFYRAVDILRQAGLEVDIDSGFTDEGDPWFVFVRPDSGDVIAHFARIDGLFIAVSSLTQEVHKGDNIRVIVDRLLKTYPTLLPQNKDGGKLLLHPATAISAFLAAAFILNLEGIKATSISEVLFSAISGSSNYSQTSENETKDHRAPGNGVKSENGFSIFSDLNSSNYNVAAIGAALIVHELSQGAAYLDKSNFLSIYEPTEIAEKEVSSDTKDSFFSISFENDRAFGDGDQKEGASQNSAVNTHYQNFDDGKVDNEENKTQSAFDATHDVVLNEPGNEEMSNFGEGYNFPLQREKVDLDVPAENIHAAVVSEMGHNVVLADSEKLILEEGIRTTDMQVSSDEVIIIPDNSVKLGEALSAVNDKVAGIKFELFGNVQELSFASINIDSFSSKTESPQVSSSSKIKPTLDYIVLDEASTSNFEATTQDSSDAGNVRMEFAPTKPILGHSLDMVGPHLSLTNAIDVVFYKGGDVEVSNFELGTDLLWFFLTPEELATANKSLNSQGDLALDFGEIGKLTFLSVISDNHLEIAV